MHTNAYLYGEGVEVMQIPQEVIDDRLGKLKVKLAELLDHSYYTRDGVRCNEVLEAIDFWESINKRNV